MITLEEISRVQYIVLASEINKEHIVIPRDISNIVYHKVIRNGEFVAIRCGRFIGVVARGEQFIIKDEFRNVAKQVIVELVNHFLDTYSVYSATWTKRVSDIVGKSLNVSSFETRKDNFRVHISKDSSNISSRGF